MKIYDDDDEVTMYFILCKQSDGTENVMGYTDDKDLAKSYLEFHNCKRFRMKTMTDRFGKILGILEQNVHDEIVISNINIRDPKRKHELTEMAIPITRNEASIISGERESLMASRVNYRVLNASVGFLKSKYQRALHAIHLEDAIQLAIYDRPTKLIARIGIDDLLVFVRTRPDDFGN